jgi:hypothetical protein
MWGHLLWHSGAELDRFCSCPDYFTKDRREVKRLKLNWAGHPQVIAEASFTWSVRSVDTPANVRPVGDLRPTWVLRAEKVRCSAPIDRSSQAI